MARKEARLDIEELKAAVAGRTIFLVGAGIFVVAYATLVIDGSFFHFFNPLLIFVPSMIGSFLLAYAALRARPALGLSPFGIILGCILSAVIPCFFLLLVISLLIRFENYFGQWQMHLQQRNWSAKAFLLSEAGQTWQTITYVPGPR